ncbi:TPA: winged helix-turn-helix transcriptional regulator [Aeromonas veronii]|nr:winged helix-turn-helix transcriptional regulator [Aeromonas veronii]
MLELDTDSGELTWYGKPLARLSRSETLLLEHFIEHPESLISQDNLLDAGWPQSVVAPNTLVVAIKNIRKSLSKTRLSIETVHRRGYIFHAGDDIARATSADKKVISENVSVDECIHNDIEDLDATHSIKNTAPKIEISTKNNTGKDDELLIEEANAEHLFSIRKSFVSLSSLFSKPVKVVLFYILFLVSIIAAFFVYELTHEWHCYQMGDTSVCGIFQLNNMQKSVLSTELEGESGGFLYGYENDFSKIKIYKIH